MLYLASIGQMHGDAAPGTAEERKINRNCRSGNVDGMHRSQGGARIFRSCLQSIIIKLKPAQFLCAGGDQPAI
ncbi:hypothetical protein D1822_16570 [Phaeobacter inhibens]|nr:hypothetical protein PGA1_c33660 [Phaeobacter inhibens DSM 17395]AXT24288.1 hypothetical protein D1822_16570 [Phaeobacter inhibens]